jgi:hypothetical protein
VQRLAPERSGHLCELRREVFGVACAAQHDLEHVLMLAQGVDAIERYGNRQPRVEKLVSAWNQCIREVAEAEDGADVPSIGASAEPKKRPRTRPTNAEVDAMRTARAQSVSMNGIAERFGVTYQTVWEKT